MKWIESVSKFLASLKLAVIIVVALGIASGWGTIVEARYDMITAQKLVYHSWYMYTILFFLIINLIAVMVDRLPWKRRHIGFVMAHVGIVVLLLGAYITRVVGIDGTLVMDVGESQRYISLIDQNEVVVYQMKNFEESEKVFQQNVEFLVHPPKKNPVEVPLQGDLSVNFIDYMPYAQKSFDVLESDKMMDGPALRFQLSSPMATFTEWLIQMGTQPVKLNLGPALVVLSRDERYETLGGLNEIVLWPSSKKDRVHYKILDPTGKVKKQGTVAQGEEVDTGWMGLQFKPIQYYPKAKVKYKYEALEYPTPLSVSAAKFEYKGQEYWLGLNTAMELYDEDSVYFITYGNRRIDLGFPLRLERFDLEKYQGTEMAAGYKSVVSVPGLGLYEISMNEPLKHKGFTFYQSSYQQDKTGAPTGTVLSVNKDPGRVWKYLGSFLIVAGSIVLFFFKKSLRREALSHVG